MSWVKDLMKSACPCKWSCCMQSADMKINREYFWNSLNDMKERDYTFNPSNTLIFEKNIHLNNDGGEYRSVLSIGLDPENEFAVAARLEVKKTSSILMLDCTHLKSLLECLKDYESNILQTFPIENTRSKYKLEFYQMQPRILDMCIHGRSISIDEDSLKTLCRMRLHITRLISSLEEETKKCETLFFKLLGHFCYEKTVQEASDLAQTDFKRHFFEEIISLHCWNECLEKSFVTEIAIHFEQWFSKCVDYFIDTTMLVESERLKTFSSNKWPHKEEVASVEKLAKTGLFYVGTSDNTQCAFCSLILHKWKPNDDPVLDHFKYNPRCSFLRNHECSFNVSDVGEQSELGKMMRILKKKKAKDSFDEVDYV